MELNSVGLWSEMNIFRSVLQEVIYLQGSGVGTVR